VLTVVRHRLKNIHNEQTDPQSYNGIYCPKCATCFVLTVVRYRLKNIHNEQIDPQSYNGIYCPKCATCFVLTVARHGLKNIHNGMSHHKRFWNLNFFRRLVLTWHSDYHSEGVKLIEGVVWGLHCVAGGECRIQGCDPTGHWTNSFINLSVEINKHHISLN